MACFCAPRIFAMATCSAFRPELEGVGEERKNARAPILPNTLCPEVFLPGTVQRIQALLRTCCNEVFAVYCDDILVLLCECQRNCLHGRRTVSEQWDVHQCNPCPGSCSSTVHLLLNLDVIERNGDVPECINPVVNFVLINTQ